jgi:3-deoxy-D-manno-octulosonate 8-phosphate phosphatase (KDO 8-P phosphatase)
MLPTDQELTQLIEGIRLLAFDFDGVFTDNAVYVDESGRESVRCSRGDGFGLKKLRELGIEMIIISTETNPVVGARAEKLKLPCWQGVEDKRAVLLELMRERGLNASQVAFMGNDINDLECLDMVGLPVVVEDAHPDILPSARYRTRARGGYGAVREVCDLIHRVRTHEREMRPHI